jgi:hypothetical protein
VSSVEGYHLFTDRYYSGVQLAQELGSQKCHTTGTITHFTFSTYALVAPTFRAKPLAY